MLTISEVTSATGAKQYYATADYYSEGQETVGHWGGKLAGELGLCGKVGKVAFERMVDNLDPETGERLTARTNHYRRVGYDFTVSLNKSASIVRAFAGDGLGERMDAARDDAIAFMMAAVEADMQCRERRHGADHDIRTGNLAYAMFHHKTSRPVAGQPPDMNEHSHLLIFNATRRADGRILAGQFGGLKRDGEYYSALFDAIYARNLQEMGFVIDRKGGKKWEIGGITPSMIGTFSKRKDEVEDAARRLNITDPAEKAELGAKTRSKKDKQLTMPELREAWWAQLNDEERDALARVYGGQIAPGREVSAEQALTFAIAHLSEQKSVLDERELKAAALQYGLGCVTPELIEREMQAPQHGLIADEHRRAEGRDDRGAAGRGTLHRWTSGARHGRRLPGRRGGGPHTHPGRWKVTQRRAVAAHAGLAQYEQPRVDGQRPGGRR